MKILWDNNYLIAPSRYKLTNVAKLRYQHGISSNKSNVFEYIYCLGNWGILHHSKNFERTKYTNNTLGIGISTTNMITTIKTHI